MSLYGDIMQVNFFDLKNSKNHQINGDLEPLKGFGINFFGSYHPLIYLFISWIMIKQRGRPLAAPKKPCLNSWQGSAKPSPPLLSPPSSQSCTDEDNSVNRSTMDALRYSKKIITPLTVTVLFLFTFFNLILDAPRTYPTSNLKFT